MNTNTFQIQWSFVSDYMLHKIANYYYFTLKWKSINQNCTTSTNLDPKFKSNLTTMDSLILIGIKKKKEKMLINQWGKMFRDHNNGSWRKTGPQSALCIFLSILIG